MHVCPSLLGPPGTVLDTLKSVGKSWRLIRSSPNVRRERVAVFHLHRWRKHFVRLQEMWQEFPVHWALLWQGTSPPSRPFPGKAGGNHKDNY